MGRKKSGPAVSLNLDAVLDALASGDLSKLGKDQIDALLSKAREAKREVTGETIEVAHDRAEPIAQALFDLCAPLYAVACREGGLEILRNASFSLFNGQLIDATLVDGKPELSNATQRRIAFRLRALLAPKAPWTESDKKRRAKETATENKSESE